MVRAVLEKSTGVEYALKVIPKAFVSVVRGLEEEIRVLTNIHHENIISLYRVRAFKLLIIYFESAKRTFNVLICRLWDDKIKMYDLKTYSLKWINRAV